MDLMGLGDWNSNSDCNDLCYPLRTTDCLVHPWHLLGSFANTHHIEERTDMIYNVFTVSVWVWGDEWLFTASIPCCRGEGWNTFFFSFWMNGLFGNWSDINYCKESRCIYFRQVRVMVWCAHFRAGSNTNTKHNKIRTLDALSKRS